MDAIARPVDPAVREEIGAELLTRLRRGDAPDVEARELEPAVAPFVGQEAQILSSGHEINHRLLLVLEVLQRWEPGMSIVIGLRAADGDTVLAQDLDRCASGPGAPEAMDCTKTSGFHPGCASPARRDR